MTVAVLCTSFYMLQFTRAIRIFKLEHKKSVAIPFLLC